MKETFGLGFGVDESDQELAVKALQEESHVVEHGQFRLLLIEQFLPHQPLLVLLAGFVDAPERVLFWHVEAQVLHLLDLYPLHPGLFKFYIRKSAKTLKDAQLLFNTFTLACPLKNCF